jgi:hypothetical protein
MNRKGQTITYHCVVFQQSHIIIANVYNEYYSVDIVEMVDPFTALSVAVLNMQNLVGCARYGLEVDLTCRAILAMGVKCKYVFVVCLEVGKENPINVFEEADDT